MLIYRKLDSQTIGQKTTYNFSNKYHSQETSLYPCQGVWILSVSWVGSSSTYYKASYMHSFRPRGYLDQLLAEMCLAEETREPQRKAGRHTWRVTQARTLELWGRSATHCTTVPPLLQLSLLKYLAKYLFCLKLCHLKKKLKKVSSNFLVASDQIRGSTHVKSFGHPSPWGKTGSFHLKETNECCQITVGKTIEMILKKSSSIKHNQVQEHTVPTHSKDTKKSLKMIVSEWSIRHYL